MIKCASWHFVMIEQDCQDNNWIILRLGFSLHKDAVKRCDSGLLLSVWGSANKECFANSWGCSWMKIRDSIVFRLKHRR